MGRAKKNVDEDLEEDIDDSEETESTGGVKRKRAPKKAAAASKGGKSSGKGSKAKKSKAPPSDEEEEEEEEDEEDDANDSAMKDVPKYFHSGNFVLAKADVKWDGDKVTSNLKDFNLWKIDAKVLLQKFVPLDQNGQVVHKATSAYSGWDVDNRENYYPISEILDMNPKTDSKEVCVALNLDDIIKVRDK